MVSDSYYQRHLVYVTTKDISDEFSDNFSSMLRKSIPYDDVVVRDVVLTKKPFVEIYLGFNGVTFTVFHMGDEWYYLSSIFKNYKCDQLDGILRLIDDLKTKWEDIFNG